MKYYHIKFFSFIFLLLVAGSGHAAGWQKAVKCADKKAQKKYYAMAAEKFEYILRKKNLPADSAYTVRIKLADCYMKMGNTIKAESNYSEAVKSGKADINTTFNYARSLQSNNKYAEAKDWFDKIAEDKIGKEKNAKGFSDKCDKALKSATDNKYNITRESFNTTASEYAPAYYLKGLVYTSNTNERFVASQRTMWNKERFTDIYTVQEDNKGDLKVRDKLPAPINSKLNDGAATFNAAFDEAFFTRNNKHCKKHDQLQILTSKYNGTNWSTPKVLSFEMSGASYAHPSLAQDGNTLYFSSDVSGNGSLGGMDLYMVRRSNNGWESPVNLGSTINTSGNETFPFIAADSSLYFTSDGHPGYGGMDLFHSKFKDGKFNKPDNMGVDFNSSKDDLSLIVDIKNRTGYFASNRDGDDDIFSFRLPVKKTDDREKGKDGERPGGSEAMRTGRVVDKITGTPLPGTRIEVSRPSNQLSGSFYYTNDSGIFSFARKIDADDQIKAIKTNYKTNTFYGANVADAKSFEISMDSEVIISTTRLNFTTIYYDVNKSNLTNSSLETLRPVVDAMKSSPDYLVYVSGYADERGADTYNFGLSLRRVKEVIDFLSSQGVDMLRVRSAFFGAVKLSANCRKSPKCVVDTDRENRRVEIYISNQ
jgi:outer membrane protein OmpA-like peptidoglycan-associated protein/tetratricopeptide (TPR) repeat protein